MKQYLSAFGDKEFRTTLVAITVPVALQNVVIYGINLVDTIIVGRLGEIPLSAAAIANQLFFIFSVLCFGIVSGANVLIAQYWGKRDVHAIKQVLAIMYRAVTAVSLVFFALALFCPRFVMGLFSPDTAVIAQGVLYLRIVGWSYLPTAIVMGTSLVLRSVGTVNIFLLTSCLSLVLNAVLSSILVFGLWGAPKMGIAGAAVGTVVTRVVELLAAVLFVWRYEDKLYVRLHDLKEVSRPMLRDFVAHAAPVACNELLWASGAAVVMAIIGHIGTDFVAANTICAIMNQMASVFIYGVSSAAGAIIGNTIGAGQYELARQRSWALVLVGVICGLLGGGLIFVSRGWVLRFYNLSASTYALAMDIAAILAVVTVFIAFSFVSMIGVLRGGGDSRFVLICDVIFLWLVAIPLGAYAGFVLGWAPALVYSLLRSDELIKTVAAFFRLAGGKWVKDVTR